MPKHAMTDEEIQSCFAVMSELRTHLVENEFVDLIRHMESEGYKLAYIKDRGNVVAVSGYRMYTNLFMGKQLYVDDLVTSASFRSQGFGEAMVSWLRNIAKDNGCRYFHLDSGTQRTQAHKFYFSQGLSIASFHFSEQLETD